MKTCSRLNGSEMKEIYREEIRRATEVMRRGGIILYPTDTIWGIGCDATNSEAVRKIYALKQRTESKSMLVLIDSEAKLQGLVTRVPEIAYDLIEVTDRPLTIIFSGARGVASELIAQDGTLGIRVTKEEFSQQLCQQMRSPIVSTSANVSGKDSPRTFSEIDQEIIDGVDYVVGVRQREPAPKNPSQIISLGATGEIKVLRQ